MNALAQLCLKSPVLHTLRSVTLTVHHHLPLKDWTESVLSLLASSPLEVFQIYSTGAVFESPPTAQFWRNIVSHHGSRLTRLSVHRMLIGLDSIEDICRRCTRLEQLFIVVEYESLVSISQTSSCSDGDISCVERLMWRLTSGAKPQGFAHQLSVRSSNGVNSRSSAVRGP